MTCRPALTLENERLEAKLQAWHRSRTCRVSHDHAHIQRRNPRPGAPTTPDTGSHPPSSDLLGIWSGEVRFTAGPLEGDIPPEPLNAGRVWMLKMPIDPIEGGLPVLVEGRCVGAVSVAGMLAHLDAAIPEAGLTALDRADAGVVSAMAPVEGCRRSAVPSRRDGATCALAAGGFAAPRLSVRSLP
jgi:hypothetical protein